MKNLNIRWIVGGIILTILIIIGLVILFRKETPGTASKPNQSLQGEIVEMSIEPNSWEFTPKTIRLKKNVRYTVEIKNKDTYPHGFAVEELQINELLPPNSTTSFNITPDNLGTFTSYCTVPSGQGHLDMRGKVEITE